MYFVSWLVELHLFEYSSILSTKKLFQKFLLLCQTSVPSRPGSYENGRMPSKRTALDGVAGCSRYKKWKKAGLSGEGKTIKSAEHTSGIAADCGVQSATGNTELVEYVVV